MFKIAYGAGHNNFTANGIPKDLDPKKTNEWVLNDRIARYFAQAAGAYEGVSLLRVDDPAGVAPTVLKTRVADANNWKADMFLSIHHNAGINGGTGGGVVAFSYAEGTPAARYRDAIYDACIRNGGLRGNRASPKTTAGFYVLRYTDMPAVLMEYGFMDSQTDVPVILTDAYAKAMAYATMEGIAQVAGLEKRSEEPVCISLPNLGRGESSATVKAMQQLLLGAGYSLPQYGADGIFGQETELVVRAFQLSQGLTVNGIVDRRVWERLLGV